MKSRKWAACILWCNFFFKLKARKSLFKNWLQQHLFVPALAEVLTLRCFLWIRLRMFIITITIKILTNFHSNNRTDSEVVYIIYTHMIMKKTFCGQAHLRSDWGVGYSWFKFVRQTNSCGRECCLKKFFFSFLIVISPHEMGILFPFNHKPCQCQRREIICLSVKWIMRVSFWPQASTKLPVCIHPDRLWETLHAESARNFLP